MTDQAAMLAEAQRDPVTGVFNAAYLAERMDIEFRRAKRYRKPLSCLCVDVDQLEVAREAFGEEFVSQVLRHVGQVVQRLIRDVDFVSRTEDNQFIVVLPDTAISGASAAAGKLLDLLRSQELNTPNGPARVEVSIGVAGYSRAAMSSEADLLEAAREQCRRAREQGGDQIAEQPPL